MACDRLRVVLVLASASVPHAPSSRSRTAGSDAASPRLRVPSLAFRCSPSSFHFVGDPLSIPRDRLSILLAATAHPGHSLLERSPRSALPRAATSDSGESTAHHGPGSIPGLQPAVPGSPMHPRRHRPLRDDWKGGTLLVSSADTRRRTSGRMARGFRGSSQETPACRRPARDEAPASSGGRMVVWISGLERAGRSPPGWRRRGLLGAGASGSSPGSSPDYEGAHEHVEVQAEYAIHQVDRTARCRDHLG